MENNQIAEVEEVVVVAQVQEKQEKPKPTKKSTFSKSVLRRELELNHQRTQNLIGHFYRRLSVALYNINVILQILSEKVNKKETTDMVDAAERFIEAELNNLNINIDNKIKEAGKIYEEHGIPINRWKEEVKATAPYKFKISVASRDAVRYLNIVAKLDQYLSIVDYIWLEGLLDNKKHVKLVHNSIVEMHRFVSKAINIEKSTFEYINSLDKNIQNEVSTKVAVTNEEVNISDEDTKMID